MDARRPGGEISQEDVMELYQELARHGIEIWLDGGWGVDALLEVQTRPHSDLDVVVQQEDLNQLVALLRSRGYDNVPRDDTRAWNFVLGDPSGREIDIHVVVLDDGGNGIYGPPENGQHYPAEALSGSGRVGGQPVRCLTAAYQVANHSGYELEAKDFADVRKLCGRFDISIPTGQLARRRDRTNASPEA